MQLRAASLIATAVIACTTLVGCGQASNAPGAGSVLRELGTEPTQGFDPNKAFTSASLVPMAMMYETLTERDDSGKIVGSLAQSWTVSPDGKTYTFTLRQGVEFSDGSPITPDDVKYSIERAKAGDVLKSQLAGISSIETSGSDQVIFTLAKPMSTFTSLLGRPGSAAILSKKVVEADKNYFTKPTSTSGPWTLSEYTPKSQMVFTVNKHYYNVPKIGKVVITFGTDPTASAAALKSGSVDIAVIGYNDVANVKQEGQINIIQSDVIAPLFFGWDRTKAPFDNLKVRQAVSWAVDRTGKQSACWYGTGAVTYGNILRPWDPDYVEINAYKAASRDEALQKAGDLLDEAGWKVPSSGGTRVAQGVPGVSDGTKLSFSVEYESNWPAAACHVQLLQQSLKQVGIDARPRAYDPSAYWGDVPKGKFTMYHGAASATDGLDLYENWFKTGGSLTALTTHLNDPAIDAKITEAEEAGPDEAKAIIQSLERWQAENLPMLIDGYQWPQVGVSKRVHNYKAGVDVDSRNLVAASLG
ncbi:ABC transporter substrate-binding protein [Dactylosporangium sp. CA-233914]|uniref:ABC transporter substrate-binding protein n=1 Tax=Dactylosporangium sp. CA-233914 TaxID=3239934 RepID=UPI003D8F6FC0